MDQGPEPAKPRRRGGGRNAARARRLVGLRRAHMLALDWLLYLRQCGEVNPQMEAMAVQAFEELAEQLARCVEPE